MRLRFPAPSGQETTKPCRANAQTAAAAESIARADERCSYGFRVTLTLTRRKRRLLRPQVPLGGGLFNKIDMTASLPVAVSRRKPAGTASTASQVVWTTMLKPSSMVGSTK
jgi:hypothetical protein